MLQEGSLENPTDTGIVCSKQSQKQREFLPQRGDKEIQNRAPRTARRAAGTTPWLRSGQSSAARPSSEGLNSTQHSQAARERRGQRSAQAALPPSSSPAPPGGRGQAGVLPGSAAIHAAGTPALPAARHGATPEPFRGPQLLEPALKWNRGRPGANPSAPRGCGRRRAPPLSGPGENPQSRAAVAAPGSARPLSPPGTRGAGCRARSRPPSPARAPHAAEAAAPPGSSQPPRSGSAAANKAASHWPRRGPLLQQGRRRLAPAVPRPPRRTRAMLTVRRAALGQSERAGGGRAGPRARARPARDAGRGGAGGETARARVLKVTVTPLSSPQQKVIFSNLQELPGLCVPGLLSLQQIAGWLKPCRRTGACYGCRAVPNIHNGVTVSALNSHHKLSTHSSVPG